MKRIRHVNVQENLEPHRLFDFVLDSRDVRLCLEYISVQPSIVPAEANERLGRLGRDH